MMKPTRTMRIGMMLGAGGFMAVFIATGLWFADIGGPLMPTLINLGATISLAGAIILAFGGVRYLQRHRRVVGKRVAQQKAMGEGESDDAPAEEAELAPDKRREARDVRSKDEGKAMPAEPEAENPPLAKSDSGTKARPAPAEN